GEEQVGGARAPRGPGRELDVERPDGRVGPDGVRPRARPAARVQHARALRQRRDHLAQEQRPLVRADDRLLRAQRAHSRTPAGSLSVAASSSARGTASAAAAWPRTSRSAAYAACCASSAGSQVTRAKPFAFRGHSVTFARRRWYTFHAFIAPPELALTRCHSRAVGTNSSR